MCNTTITRSPKGARAGAQALHLWTIYMNVLLTKHSRNESAEALMAMRRDVALVLHNYVMSGIFWVGYTEGAIYQSGYQGGG